MPRPSLSLLAFVAMAFGVVGLTGMFATYAVPLPLERALARETALDDALTAARGPDAAAAVTALEPRLDDSLPAILPVDAGFAARVAAERVAMRQRFTVEAEVTATRLRWLVGVVTLMGAAFGLALMGAGRGEG